MSMPRGRLEVITGTMFSGKTEELLRRFKRVQIAGQKSLIFKPTTDTRSGTGLVKSNGGPVWEAVEIPTTSPHRLEYKLTEWERENGRCDVIGLDEVQFFSRGSPMIGILSILVRRGYLVIAAGLDLDFRGEPFGLMPEILALADRVDKLTAVCKRCGCFEARFPQRLVDGEVAPFDTPVIQVGGEESYEARCRECFIFPRTLERRKGDKSITPST